MKVVPRGHSFRNDRSSSFPVRRMKGVFVCSETRSQAQLNNCITKGFDGTSSGSLSHLESGRMLENPYARTVKKTPMPREEITFV